MAYPSTIKGEGPIEETILKIAIDEYFDAIEITWINERETRKRVKKMLDSAHLSVAYGAQPRLLTTGQNINDLDESKRQIAVANLKEGIDEAYEMGAVGFGFLSGKYTEDKKEDAYQALVNSTKEICTYAKSKGNLKIALEVFDFDIEGEFLVSAISREGSTVIPGDDTKIRRNDILIGIAKLSALPHIRDVLGLKEVEE